VNWDRVESPFVRQSRDKFAVVSMTALGNGLPFDAPIATLLPA